MHPKYTLICVFFLFATGHASDDLTPNSCSFLIPIPGNGFESDPVFPIWPTDLEIGCWTLNSYASCVEERTAENRKKEFINHYILIEYLKSICGNYRNTYLKSSVCINDLRMSSEVKNCRKEKLLPGKGKPGVGACKRVRETIDCVGEAVVKCGSDAAQMTKHLLRVIVKTAWKIYEVPCLDVTPMRAPSSVTMRDDGAPDSNKDQNGRVNYDLPADACSAIIAMPGRGFAIDSIFPIIKPADLERACWFLHSYARCVQEGTPEDKIKVYTDRFILIEYLKSICGNYRNTYLKSGPCIGSYIESPKVRNCIKEEVLPEERNSGIYNACRHMNETIDCMGREIVKCGSDAVQMTKHLLRVIINTAWKIHDVRCQIPIPNKSTLSMKLQNDAVLDSNKEQNDHASGPKSLPIATNGSSKTSILSGLLCIQLLWFGIQ